MKNITVLIKQLKLEAEEIRKSLQNELSAIDNEINDIMHVLEFNKLNASQGYKIYHLLYQKRTVRRDIKNNLFICHNILNIKTNYGKYKYKSKNDIESLLKIKS